MTVKSSSSGWNFRFPAGGLCITLAVLLLGGCLATPQVKELFSNGTRGLPARIELTKVPFYPQTRYHCGPAAVSTVLAFKGGKVDYDEVVKRVYLPGRKGALQSDIVGVFRRYGYMSYIMQPKLRHLLAEIAHGRPVLVLQNLGIKWISRWHYAVVVGYDLERKRLILRSGKKKRRLESFKLFERTWRRSGYWAIVVLEPGEFPRQAKPLSYLKAAAGLEQVKNHRAAQKAYLAAESRWPSNPVAKMGVANTWYAMGDTTRAIRKYRQITDEHPQLADAWNNLAWLLLSRKKCRQARQMVDRAVRLGGRHLASYQHTRRKINKQCGK